jgi:hypothetical protein
MNSLRVGFPVIGKQAGDGIDNRNTAASGRFVVTDNGEGVRLIVCGQDIA